jgi:hypothetical protein
MDPHKLSDLREKTDHLRKKLHDLESRIADHLRKHDAPAMPESPRRQRETPERSNPNEHRD